jgi:asparagine synthase (glutamine-hydrolysing)
MKVRSGSPTGCSLRARMPFVGPHRSSRGAWLAGDIRIDGQGELRDALAASGASVPGNATDEALVLAAWHAWGEDAVARLRGDFSFALWDPARRVLLCARDAFGVRPLYYADLGDAFVCSNVLSAVRAHPAVTSRLHEPAIVSFLCHGFNIDLTTTTFADIRRLAPAHQLAVSLESAGGATRRHSSFPAPTPLVYRREEEYVERYRELLGRAVQDRLRVPRVAIMLSGGLDSTSLAATVRRVSPGTEVLAITTDVSAFSPNDDARLAAEVAQRLGLRHEIVRETPAQLDHLRDTEFRAPEPLDEPEYAEWRRLARHISVETPVVFVGEDGDALFQPPGLLTMLRTWPAADVLARVARYTISHRHHPHLGLWLRRRLREFGMARPPVVPLWVRREALAPHRPAAGSGSAPPSDAAART